MRFVDAAGSPAYYSLVDVRAADAAPPPPAFLSRRRRRPPSVGAPPPPPPTLCRRESPAWPSCAFRGLLFPIRHETHVYCHCQFIHVSANVSKALVGAFFSRP